MNITEVARDYLALFPLTIKKDTALCIISGLLAHIEKPESSVENIQGANMKPFDNAKVGDPVYCLSAGEGRITGISYSHYPISVASQCGDYHVYTLDGKLYAYHPNRILFYLDANGNRCDERPVEKLIAPADKVPVDTRVLAHTQHSMIQEKRHYAGHQTVFNNGLTSWSSPFYSPSTTWASIELAEELTIDGVVYLVGTEVK